MKASSPNEVLTLDLKQTGKIYTIWIICALSKFARGVVLRSKEASVVVRAIEHGWFHLYGCPTKGFWSDNGTEFRNEKMNCAGTGISP